MRHTTWLQNRTPAQALAGQTPYKAKNKRKPHLGGIHEFGVGAYVKDLKAGKLESRAQMGRFVGYDSESKGYRIYWHQKWSVTVERNVVFKENEVQTLENFMLSSEFGWRGRVQSRARRWLQLVGCAALLLDASNFGGPDGVGESGVEPRRSLRRESELRRSRLLS